MCQKCAVLLDLRSPAEMLPLRPKGAMPDLARFLTVYNNCYNIC